MKKNTKKQTTKTAAKKSTKTAATKTTKKTTTKKSNAGPPALVSLFNSAFKMPKTQKETTSLIRNILTSDAPKTSTKTSTKKCCADAGNVNAKGKHVCVAKIAKKSPPAPAVEIAPVVAEKTETRKAKHTLYTPTLSYLKNHVRVFGIEKIAKRYGVTVEDVQKRIDTESTERVRVSRPRVSVSTTSDGCVVATISDENVPRVTSMLIADGWRTERVYRPSIVTIHDRDDKKAGNMMWRECAAVIQIAPDGTRYVEAHGNERADLLYVSQFATTRFRKFEGSSVERRIERAELETAARQRRETEQRARGEKTTAVITAA